MQVMQGVGFISRHFRFIIHLPLYILFLLIHC